MAETFTRLEAEYCPPLDPALLSAILSDYDLNVEEQIQNARDTLDPLKESALLEEQFGFDAAGTGVQDEGLISATRPESCPGTSASVSRETDLTSLSNGLSSLDLEHGDSSPIPGEGATAEEIERLDEETKILLLQDIFHDRVSRYKTEYTLRKCNGGWHKAMEELLNHVYFNESGEDQEGGKVPRGIEAFSEDHVVRRGRKKKGKGRSLHFIDERRSSSLPVSPTDAPAPPSNKWQTAGQDIEFITSRTGLSNKTVTSIYYSNGTSLPKAIAGVLKDSVKQGKADLGDDPILAINSHDLGVEFPTIAAEYARTIVRLTHPSTAAAHELAKALTVQPEVARGGIQIIPSYAKPLDDEDFVQPISKKDRATARLNLDENFNASERAAAYSAARSTALSQAYAAHRKAKSDRLMGGAAAYYSQVGRDYAMLSNQATASAADDLAHAQSSSSQLDLHGIDVLNAVRIAKQKVEQWWEALGESRANGRVGAQERQAGYTIVVGLGRHSEGGKGKLGPAVNKALREDGWKVEQSGAVLVVKGKTRK
ncbi:hypothetical protein PRZ48_001411 [Zasmidium cellare]|uniref:Smr domain-containing protein n=1 Tax=Zasmidium cellare TaxID=395010 RepID=A0ABR0F172_ZASCE|nr:hypothetical protein PRZ48_001411 [Zasmidium cellare]